MARLTHSPVQQYRGTTAQHANYTGPIAELTVDTTKATVVVHDGATAGGHPMAKESRRVIVDGTIMTVNSGAEATLGADLNVAFSVTAAAAALISGDANNGLGLGTDNKLVVSNATGIVAADDELLHVNAEGKIASGIELDYDPATGTFTVSNHAGQSVASTIVPTASSVLKTVELVENPVDPEGDGVSTLTGTFFKFTWRVTTDDEGTTEEQSTLLDVTRFFDVYEGGNGISVTGKVIAAVVVAGGGLKVDAAGLAADYPSMISADSGNLITEGSDGKLNAAPYVAGSGITVADRTIGVKTATANAVHVDADGSLALNVGKGLVKTPGTDGGHAKIEVSPSALISGDADNIMVAGADNGLYVAPYTAGDGIAVTGKVVSAKLAATNNNLMVNDAGELYVPADYGTMD